MQATHANLLKKNCKPNRIILLFSTTLWMWSTDNFLHDTCNAFQTHWWVILTSLTFLQAASVWKKNQQISLPTFHLCMKSFSGSRWHSWPLTAICRWSSSSRFKGALRTNRSWPVSIGNRILIIKRTLKKPENPIKYTCHHHRPISQVKRMCPQIFGYATLLYTSKQLQSAVCHEYESTGRKVLKFNFLSDKCIFCCRITSA